MSDLTSPQSESQAFFSGVLDTPFFSTDVTVGSQNITINAWGGLNAAADGDAFIYHANAETFMAWAESEQQYAQAGAKVTQDLVISGRHASHFK